MHVEYRVLGPLEADVDGRAVDLGGRSNARRSRSCSAPNTLVPGLDRRRPLGRRPSWVGANLVQGYVSGLRKALGREAIETRGAGYMLTSPPGALDLHDSRLAPREAARSRTAIPLWPPRPSRRASPSGAVGARRPRGGAAARPRRSGRLEELRVLALERRIEADLALGRHADVVGRWRSSSPSTRSANGRAGS